MGNSDAVQLKGFKEFAASAVPYPKTATISSSSVTSMLSSSPVISSSSLFPLIVVLCTTHLPRHRYLPVVLDKNSFVPATGWLHLRSH